jgi:hypothetical protein
MKNSQIRCFWIYSALVILLTTIPYLIGFETQGQNLVFTGFVFGVEDGNSYIAKMMIGSAGDWLFRTPYSSEPQRGVLAFLPYILIGKLAAGAELHLQLVLLFHLFRIAVIPLAIWATYRFMDYFLSDDRWSAWSTVLATMGSGLGWIVVLFDDGIFEGSMPLGFISPETFGFLAYYGLPHLVLARALLLLGLRWYLEGMDSPRSGWKAGAAIAGLGFAQPLAMVSAYAVIGVHQILYIVRFWSDGFNNWKVRWMPSLSRLLVIASPVLFYFFLVFSTDPFLTLWTDQNLILSPGPIHYLLAYGLVLPLVILGLIRAWSSDKRQWLLPVGWTLVLPLLAYAPYNLQRRLPEGGWNALVLLAAYGLSRLSKRQLKGFLRVAIILLSLITPILLIYGGSVVARWGEFPAFRESGEIAAFGWLRDHAEKDSIVLGSFQTGNALPAWAPVHVVIGHGPESANLAKLKPQVESFYSGDMSLDERESFFENQRVDYIFFGPRELMNGADEASLASDLERVYHQGEYSIFRVSEE